VAKLNRKFCKFLVKTRRLYRKNSNFCNIFFSIFAGCAIGLIAFQLFAPKPKYPTELQETSTPPKTKNLIVKRLLVENLNCLKIKGQTVIVEKRHKGLSYAVFEFPIEAKLSVSLSGLKNINNDILTLSQPFVSSARINHNKKTLRFCKVCISYCQITIPCIFSIQTQLKLQLTTAQIALMNNLLSECDSLIRGIIGSIEKQVLENLDKNESEFIINFTKALLGFMVLVPSDPENPFELIKMVLEIFSSELLQKTNLVKKTKMSIYPAAIKYLTTLMQNKLPYHIANVESNDEIFTGDENFEMEGREIIESIINQILTDVSEFNEKLKPFETEDCEFLTMLCSECFEVFKYNFEETKFQINVQNKMLQLIEKFIGMLETNKMFQGNKTEKLKNYFIQLTKN
jgi:hypothetical protein